MRVFSCILSALPFFLGYLWIVFDPKKQGWHDKLAGTLVIKCDENDKK
ncbi:MAG: RDD family protein [Pseudomonadota bacterium]